MPASDLSPRPCVKGASPYLPGKPIAEVQRELGLRRVVKLASNENPLGPSPRAAAAAKRACAEGHIYPEGSAPLLRKALAARLGVPPSCVIAASGSDEIINLLCQAFLSPGDEAVVSQYGFIRFKQCAMAAGARAVEVPMRGWTQDAAAMAKAVSARTKIVFLANPNNPTGTYSTRAEVEALLRSVPRGVLVVLDEAYHEYARPREDYPDAAREFLPSHPNLFVLRTFSKAYGLAGLRVGYGAGSPEVVGWLDRIRLPFNVSAPAQRAAVEALKDAAFVRRSVSLVEREKAVLARDLRSLGWECGDSAANFLFLRPPAPGREVFEALIRRGVVIRALDEYGLGAHVRVTVGTRAQNKLLVAAVKDMAAGRRARPSPRLCSPRTGRKEDVRARWVIAIDGPAGVGKSSVGQRVAEKLGYRFVNTGEMYRALTWEVLERNIDPLDANAVAGLAASLKWEFRADGRGTVLGTCVDGRPMTERIRDERVGRNSSLVAGIPAVREFLRGLQRELGRGGGIVMEGRDIGTDVFPDAELKVYLDASVSERAGRRYRQLKEAGVDVDLDRIKADIAARDRMDRKRKINPLRMARGAARIDSTRLSLDQVAERILRLARRVKGRKR